MKWQSINQDTPFSKLCIHGKRAYKGILQAAGNIFKYIDRNGGIMEELLVYMILFYEGFVTEIEYHKRLDELFLTTPEDDDLLYLEWETDIGKAIIYVRTHIDYKNLDMEQFGRILMNKLNVVYKNCPDIKYFASQMYRLWESLPGNIQNIEPFWTLCYADDPLAWGDEKQTRDIYEHMLRY